MIVIGDGFCLLVLLLFKQLGDWRLSPIRSRRALLLSSTRRRPVAAPRPHHPLHIPLGLLHLLPQATHLPLDHVVLGQKTLQIANLADVTGEARLRLVELILESGDGLGVVVRVGRVAVGEVRGDAALRGGKVGRRGGAAERVLNVVEGRGEVTEVGSRVA